MHDHLARWGPPIAVGVAAALAGVPFAVPDGAPAGVAATVSPLAVAAVAVACSMLAAVAWHAE